MGVGGFTVCVLLFVVLILLDTFERDWRCLPCVRIGWVSLDMIGVYDLSSHLHIIVDI